MVHGKLIKREHAEANRHHNEAVAELLERCQRFTSWKGGDYLSDL